MSELEQLPDYPALRDVLRALWGQSEVRGAALMVGAGFSRLATPVSANATPLPLWSDFARRMGEELYPVDPSRAPYDPLRLAEEYRAAMGAPALENLIRGLVPDKKWNPSDHHRRLVALPWSDILTTNWDTLLERAAASDPDRRYELVVAPQDVARTRAPRIVKLHGSLPANPPFIFTQEDYRTYPARFAPFVNLAQQVLLENELCLVGFSGNDPNFLQWTGWVRDQLGNLARPIRLIGVLDLQPSQRALLAEQNITPIDLAPIVKEFSHSERHREAMTRLIEAFEKAKPAAPGKWNRETDRESFGESFTVNALLTRLERDRRADPGWLLVPTHERHRLRRDTEDVIRSVDPLLDQFNPAQRQHYAFEAAWLVERSGWMHPAQLHALYLETVSAERPEIARSELHFIAIALARVARATLDEVAFNDALARASELAISADELAATAYERCLWHRDRIEHGGIEAQLHRIKGNDPIWTMRRAALLADLKRDREAAQQVREAALEIRSRRAQDPHSLWLISREAWIHFFWREARFELSGADGEFEKIDGLSGFDDWPLRYTEHKCDPWEELRYFDATLDEELADRAKRIRRDTPRFDAGTWKREGTGTVTYNYSRVLPWNMLGYLIDTIGIVRSGHFNTVETRLERAGELLGNETLPDWLARIRAVRRREDGFVETAFGRIAIARLDAQLAVELFAKLKTAIDYGRKRFWRDERLDDGEQRSSGWVEEVRIYLELISRIVVRLDPDEAISAFRWGCEIGTDSDFTHWWLFKPLSHLLDRCLDAIPPSRHGELALDMVRFPVVDTNRHGMLRDWPNFANRLADIPTISREGSGWDEAIARAIEAARDINPEVRTRGILMILPLYRLGLLKPSETEAFSHAVWSRRDGSGLPDAHYIISSGFLDGPPPPDGSIGEAFQASVIRPLASGTLTDETLISLARASDADMAGIAPLSEANATEILAHVADWPAPQPHEWDRDYHRQEERDKRLAAGEALARAVLPALRNGQLSPAIREALLTSSVPDRAPELMQGLPEIAVRESNFSSAIVERISLALASTKADLARAAIGAAISWSRLATESATAFPAALATEVAGCCLARRPASLYGALHAAVELVRADHFSQADIAKLVAALDLLWVETDYANVEAGDAIAVTLTLVRCECIRLAVALADRGAETPVISLWRGQVESDPMPEVRFALETE